MDSDILTFFSFTALMLICALVIEKKKSRNWVNWTGAVLTSLIGGGIIAGLLSGTLLLNIPTLIEYILLMTLGIYLMSRKQKSK